jgi:hypothetical protein
LRGQTEFTDAMLRYRSFPNGCEPSENVSNSGDKNFDVEFSGHSVVSYLRKHTIRDYTIDKNTNDASPLAGLFVPVRGENFV